MGRKSGRAGKLCHPRVTAQGHQVGAVVCVHAKGMKEPWCPIASDSEATAAVLVNHYAKRRTIEPSFGDTKDLRLRPIDSFVELTNVHRHLPLYVRADAPS
jgi:hypothetical protein